MSQPPIQVKAKLREDMEQLRSSLSLLQRQEKSRHICEKLQQLFTAKELATDERTVFTYIPFRTEVDISAFIEWCWTKKVKVLTSRLQQADMHMELCCIQSLDDLESGRYGVLQAKASAALYSDTAPIDAVLIPGLAFDHHGGRLGYGGGYYDRWLQRRGARNGNRPLIIAPAYHCQWVSQVPMEPHDSRVDVICTEKGYWQLETS